MQICLVQYSTSGTKNHEMRGPPVKCTKAKEQLTVPLIYCDYTTLPHPSSPFLLLAQIAFNEELIQIICIPYTPVVDTILCIKNQ